jgi:hypothetical protein
MSTSCLISVEFFIVILNSKSKNALLLANGIPFYIFIYTLNFLLVVSGSGPLMAFQDKEHQDGNW